MYLSFYFIEYQDWTDEGKPVHETLQEYTDKESGKPIIFRTKEKAKETIKELNTLTRTFELIPMKWSVDEERLSEFLIVE